jgi:hypothetical protein
MHGVDICRPQHPRKQGNEIDHRLAAPEDDRLASPDKEIAIAG